jgi:hypothetical protein
VDPSSDLATTITMARSIHLGWSLMEVDFGDGQNKISMRFQEIMDAAKSTVFVLIYVGVGNLV